MIIIQPIFLHFRQQGRVDQLPTHRDHGDILEAEPRLLAEFVVRGGLVSDDHVLYSDTEVAIFVIAGF